MRTPHIFILGVMMIVIMISDVRSQSDEFKYQGNLVFNGQPASGNFDFEFALFTALSGGTQIESTLTRTNVPVANGVFSVSLAFNDAFPGAHRFLEIRVRSVGGGAFTILTPRQQVLSTPYALTSQKASNADRAVEADFAEVAGGAITADTASNALALGGLLASQYVLNNDPRLTDARTPTAGSTNYIQNQSGSPQSGSFNITGNATIGGVISGNGSGLTNINGASVSAGTVTSSQLSSDVILGIGQNKLIATLRWDLLRSRTFEVGNEPRLIAFDGVNVWITRGNSTVTRLRAVDGANLGTFPVGLNPRGIVFDGANIWVVNSGNNNVVKLRASDGANLGTFAVGTNPQEAVFDGTNIWVANFDSGNVTKLRASDGVNLGTFAVGTNPQAIAYDGLNVWVANSGSGNVSKLQPSNGQSLGTFSIGGVPRDIAFDGVHLWVADSSGNTLKKLVPSTGAIVGSILISNQGFLTKMLFDGMNIWITNSTNAMVYKLRLSDGIIAASVPVANSPDGIAFDGTYIWVGTSLGASTTVTRIPAFLQQ